MKVVNVSAQIKKMLHQSTIIILIQVFCNLLISLDMCVRVCVAVVMPCDYSHFIYWLCSKSGFLGEWKSVSNLTSLNVPTTCLYLTSRACDGGHSYVAAYSSELIHNHHHECRTSTSNESRSLWKNFFGHRPNEPKSAPVASTNCDYRVRKWIYTVNVNIFCCVHS